MTRDILSIVACVCGIGTPVFLFVFMISEHIDRPEENVALIGIVAVTSALLAIAWRPK